MLASLHRFKSLETSMDRRTVTVGLALIGTGAFATNAASQPASAHPLIAAFAKTLSDHDIEGFAALFAADYINHQMSAAAPAPSGLSAKMGTVSFFAARLKGLPDLAVAVEASLSSAEMAGASFVYSGTHRGEYFGIAPTGKSLRFTSCDIFCIRDGRFVEHWGMGDIAGTLAQLKG
jgi:predicted ester cyclase